MKLFAVFLVFVIITGLPDQTKAQNVTIDAENHNAIKVQLLCVHFLKQKVNQKYRSR